MKEPSKNAVAIGKEIDKKVKDIDKEYKGQFSIKLLASTHEQVENAVTSMGKEVILGAIAATIIILFFLRSFRTTLIAVVSIPLSILLTLFLLHQSNITLNILTLGGLAVAVGRLVDDSIVVIENIFRRLQKETFSKDIILDATKEVAVAITSSTLTTVAVFTYRPRIRSNRKINVTYGISSCIFYTIFLNRCTNSCPTYGLFTTQKQSIENRALHHDMSLH